MTKVSEIVKAARYILTDTPNDTASRGWSDERLVQLVDEAQLEICKKTSIFKREYYIPLSNGIYTYSLPDDLIKIDRVMSDKRVTQMSMADMDDIDLYWRRIIGDEIIHYILDSVNMNKLEVYPIPSEALTYVPFYRIVDIQGKFYFVLNNPVGVFTGNTPIIGELDPTTGVLTEVRGDLSIGNLTDYLLEPTIWGLITDIFGLENISTYYTQPSTGVLSGVSYGSGGQTLSTSVWGTITDVSQKVGLMDATWGAITSVARDSSVLKVRYSALPEHINGIDSALNIPDKWTEAIKYYVAGYALLDDNDAANNNKGLQFISKFNSDIDAINKLGKSTDASKSATRFRGQKHNRGEDYGDYRRNSIY